MVAGLESTLRTTGPVGTGSLRGWALTRVHWGRFMVWPAEGPTALQPGKSILEQRSVVVTFTCTVLSDPDDLFLEIGHHDVASFR